MKLLNPVFDPGRCGRIDDGCQQRPKPSALRSLTSKAWSSCNASMARSSRSSKRRPGFEVEFTPVNNRTAAVEAMRAEQVDFVLTGPAEYVVFKKLTDAKPVVGWHRPDYFAQIVVMAEGDIKSLGDLKGKKVAFGEVGSTSQQLGPAQVLADAGLKYNVDYTAEIIKRNVAVEAMIRGDVAAVGMNLTHLRSVREKFPDAKFAVVGRGADLPNDILIVASYVKPETVEKVRKAFLEKGTGTHDRRAQGRGHQEVRRRILRRDRGRQGLRQRAGHVCDYRRPAVFQFHR